MPHSVDERVIRQVHSFIESKLPHSAEYLVPLRNPSDMSIKELKSAIREAGLSRQAEGLFEKSEFVQLLQQYYDSLK